MELIIRKRLDIFIEAHALGRLETMLGEAGFKGWSVFAGIEGTGVSGSWRQMGIGESEAKLVIAIGSTDAAKAALLWLKTYFSSYPGVVALSDVEVMRSERF